MSRQVLLEFVSVDRLLSHEQTSASRVECLVEELKLSGAVKPLLADSGSFAVLDGHHRLKALKFLGCKKAPVLFVDYSSSLIKLKPRRLIPVNKKKTVFAALNQSLPSKTTRHEFKHKIFFRVPLHQIPKK